MDHYSYTQLSTFLQCPLKYKYHYLEGWAEREDKASLAFGRVFQMAVESQFLVDDSVQFFTQHWAKLKDVPLEYANGDSWEKMLEQGQALLERFRDDQRVQIEDGRVDFQIKIRRALPWSERHFLAYIDAIGWVDGIHSLIEWKTSTQCYPESLPRMLELDPQLVCYSWVAQKQEVCLVNFIRKKRPEIQYLHARIRKRQWRAFSQTLDMLVSEMEAGHFYPRSGIRYPNNQCLNCGYLGLCLRQKRLVEDRLVKVEEQPVHG
jgi:putative RecB family exonuclease